MRTVETSPRLSLSQLRALHIWSEIIQKKEVTLTIEHEGLTITTTIDISFDRSPFGLRPWLSCPRCGSRRKDLFVDGGELSCRRCARLLYYSQRLPDSSWRDVALPLLRSASRDQLRKPAGTG